MHALISPEPMPTLREAHLLHARHYLMVLWEATHLYRKGGMALRQGLALLDREWLNIRAAQSRMRDDFSEDADAAELCSAYPNASAYFLPLRLRPSERIEWLKAAAAAARQLKDHEAESWHIGNLGKLYRSIGEPRRAIECNEQAILISRQFGDKLNEVRGLSNMALAYCDIGEMRRAFQVNEQALLLVQETDDRREEGAVLGNIGIVYALLGKHLQAIEFYKQQLLIAQETGDISAEAEAANNIGLSYLAVNQPRVALEFLTHASAIYESISDLQNQVLLLNNIGLVYLNTGEPRHALEIFAQLERLSRQAESPLGEARALFNQAEAYAILDNLGEAISRAEAALKVYERIESNDTVKVQAQLSEWSERVK
jgi:tetratricopeptide (TPR) repeat protein